MRSPEEICGIGNGSPIPNSLLGEEQHVPKDVPGDWT